MASSFPGAIDSFTDPLTTSTLNSPSHAGQHQDLNDAVEKVETYMGLVKVIPTSVTNGTLAANGTVTMNATITSITISGAFSALYDNYLVTVSGGLASTNISIGVQLGATTTGYAYSFLYTSYANTPLAVGVGSDTYFVYGGGGTTSSLAMNCNIQNPYLSEQTHFQGATANGAFAGIGAGYLNNTTSYTDLVLKASTGTMSSGTIRVYGYRN
jgi:hypothetical protein